MHPDSNKQDKYATEKMVALNLVFEGIKEEFEKN